MTMVSVIMTRVYVIMTSVSVIITRFSVIMIRVSVMMTRVSDIITPFVNRYFRGCCLKQTTGKAGTDFILCMIIKELKK